MGKLRSLAAALLAAAALSACADQPAAPLAEPSAAVPSGQLDVYFDDAAREFGVPSALLKSIGYVETGWQMVRGGVEFPGQEAAYGVMALRGDKLARGARLAGVTVPAAQGQARANIRARSDWSRTTLRMRTTSGVTSTHSSSRANSRDSSRVR